MHIIESVSWSKVMYIIANQLLLAYSSSSCVAMTIFLLISLHTELD